MRAISIEIRLRAAMAAYRRRTGLRLTYKNLAEMTGLSQSTIESIATRPQYNASLHTIGRLCAALGCTPGELLSVNDPNDS